MNEKDFSVVRSNGPLPAPEKVDASGVIEDLWLAYVDSATSLLSKLEAAAMALETGEDVDTHAGSIRRILHSIKGESGMAGLMDVYSLCHETEFGFEELADNQRADMILKVKDWIEAVIKHISVCHFPSGKNEKRKNISPENKPSPAKDKLKIYTLIIEDDLVCRELIKALLAGHCNCTTGNDGQKGFELFKKAFEAGRPYQMITLDIQMPKMDGHEVLKAIRQFESKHGVEGLDGAKVIMTTSMDNSEHVFSSFRQGCEAYVIKPVGSKLIEEMGKLGLFEGKEVVHSS
ncbi:MAG: response regulator [Planctomycetota bacterium]